MCNNACFALLDCPQENVDIADVNKGDDSIHLFAFTRSTNKSSSNSPNHKNIKFNTRNHEFIQEHKNKNDHAGQSILSPRDLEQVTPISQESCIDSSTYTFGSYPFGGVNVYRSCDWIKENEVKTRQNKWCTSYMNGAIVQDKCPVACDACPVLSQPSCPDIDTLSNKLFQTQKVSEDVSSLFEPVNGESFVKTILDTIVDSTLSVATGSVIKAGGDPYTKTCADLPLKDNECYLVASSDKSLIRLLVAKYIPFGDVIIKAIETVEGLAEQFADEVDGLTKEVKEEVKVFYDPPASDSGSCMVVNEDMFGIHEKPGLFLLCL